MINRKAWINIHTTKVTVDGHEFVGKTSAINQHGTEKVVAYIKKYFSELKNE